MTLQKDVALSYAKKGIKVFPCDFDKKPYTKNGFLDASDDLQKISEWWDTYPDALIGSPNDHFLVIDIDDHSTCATGKILTSYALERLKTEELIKEDSVHVRTMSGGSHYYYKSNSEIGRRISFLPNIDILSGGGYVILPDDKNYFCNEKNPWEVFCDLPSIDASLLFKLSEEMADITKNAKELKDKFKIINNFNSPVRKKVTKKVDIDKNSFVVAKESLSGTAKSAGFIDKKTDTIVFDIKNGLYSKTEKEFEKVDSDVKILDKEGSIEVCEGCFDSDKINKLFHNKEIQVKLGKFLGLKIPKVGDTTSMRSVLPNHTDAHPSMGVRWSEDCSHLLIRDFSNKYSDKFNQIDYNIVRLYATLFYKTAVPKLTKQEFVVWFCRLMVDAGLIDISSLIKKYPKPLNTLSDKGVIMAEKFQLLDAIKRLYSGYCGETVFAIKFASAWCQLPPSTVARLKKTLVENGFIATVGTYDCSGGTRTDGFFNSSLYKIQTENEMRVVKVSEEEARSYEQSEFRTVVTIEVNDESYLKITNFCEDMDIDFVPLQENMFVGLVATMKQVKTTVSNRDTTYFMGDLQLELVDNADESGLILICSGVSPSLEDLFYRVKESFEKESMVYDQEPLLYFVVSFDADPDLDVELLTIKFNEYMNGSVAFDEISTRTVHEEDLLDFYDGVDITAK